MKSNYKQRLDQAIVLGKEHMKESVDPMHNYTHAKNVCNMGLKIYEELKRNHEPGILKINKELVEIAAWWHDCFKATQNKPSLMNEIFEGPRSSELVRKKLGPYLNKTDMKIVTDAITNHSGFGTLIYLLRPRSFSPLFKILIESDAYDILNIDRKKHFISQLTRRIPMSLVFIELTCPIPLPLYLRTKIARKNLYARMLAFYRFMLWKDWQIIRLLFPTKRKQLSLPGT
ncbi:MAG: HD domain-containing protein [Patescibacteria group bacterium]|nr:HD domain-containing protein [Patescibacteria group bacterium]